MTEDTTITYGQFETLYTELEKNNFNIVDVDSSRKGLISKAYTRTGKIFKQIKKYVEKPEVKAVALVASWALSATMLLLVMIATSSVAVFAVSLSLFVIETYAVFGVIEYAVAYSMAQKLMKETR